MGTASPPAPAALRAPHVNVLLLLPMVFDEVAGGDVELLAVALYLQNGALDVAQQLFVLRREAQRQAPWAPTDRPLQHHPEGPGGLRQGSVCLRLRS